MNRLTLCALGVLLGTSTLFAQQQYAIKIKEPQQGDKRQCEERAFLHLSQKIYDAKGKLLADQNQTSGQACKYYEELLQKLAGAKLPEQARRYYYEANMKLEGKDSPLAYQKKNVIVRKNRQGKYEFLLEGKEKLDDSNAILLHSEFNQKRELNPRQLMIPAVPVQVGQQWSVAVLPIAKDWGVKADVQFDLEKSRGVGKLERVYAKDGKVFGVITMKAELPIRAMGRGKNGVATGKGSRILVTFTMDACIDGTVSTGDMSSRFDISYSATTKNKKGEVVQLVSLLQGSVTKKSIELSK